MKGMLNKAFSIALLISALPMVAMEQAPVAQGFMSRAGEFVSSQYNSASESLVNGYNDYVAPTVKTAVTKVSEGSTSVANSVTGHPYIYGGVAGVTALGLTGGLVYKYRRPAVVKPVVNPISILAHDFAIFAKMQEAMTKNQVIETPVFKAADAIIFGDNETAVDKFARTITAYNECIARVNVIEPAQIELAKNNVKLVIDATTKEINAIEARAEVLASQVLEALKATPVSLSAAAPVVAPKAAPKYKAPLASERKAPAAPKAVAVVEAPKADVAVVTAPAPAVAVTPKAVVVKPAYSTRTKVLVAGGLLASMGAGTFALYNYFFKSPVA